MTPTRARGSAAVLETQRLHWRRASLRRRRRGATLCVFAVGVAILGAVSGLSARKAASRPGYGKTNADSIQQSIRLAISEFVLSWRGEWTASVSGVGIVPSRLRDILQPVVPPDASHPGQLFGFRGCYP